MSLVMEHTEAEKRDLRLYAEYGIDRNEALVHVAINSAYKARFNALQAIHGKWDVPLADREALDREATRAHSIVIHRRQASQEKIEAQRKREEKKAAAAAAAGAPSASAGASRPTSKPSASRPTSGPQRAPSGPSRPTSGAQPAPAQHGTSGAAGCGTLAPAGPAGSAEQAARALAAFTGPDSKE